MRYILIFMLFTSGLFAQQQSETIRGSMITITKVPPTFVPGPGAPWFAKVITTGDFYEWDWNENTWHNTGARLYETGTSGVPAYVPGVSRKEFAINLEGELYYWTGSWNLITPDLSGYVQYSDSLATFVTPSQLSDSLDGHLTWADTATIATQYYVNSQGFLTVELDGDPTNELQTLSISNDTLYLTSGGFVVLPPSTDTSGYNQSLTYSGDTLYLTDDAGTIFTVIPSVDLTGYLTWLDTVTLATQNFVLSQGFLTAELDGDPTNELQNISINVDTVFLSNGGFIILPPSVSTDTSGYNIALSYSGDTLYLTDANGTLTTKIPLSDSIASVRAEIPDVSIFVEYGDSNIVFVTPTQLQDTSIAIRADFPINTDTSGYNQSLIFSGDTLYLIDGNGTLFAVIPSVDLTPYVQYTDSLTVFVTPSQLVDSINAIPQIDLTPYVQYADSLTTFVTPNMLTDSSIAIRGDFPVNTDDQAISIDSVGRYFTITLEDGGIVTFQDQVGIPGGGDDWGAQTVVSDGTLSGVGITGDALKVDTTIIATKSDIPVLTGYVQFSDSLTRFVTPDMLDDSTAAVRGDFPVNTDTQDLSIDSTGRFFTISLVDGGSVTFEDTNTEYDLSGYVEYGDSLTTFVTPSQLVDSINAIPAVDLSGYVEFSDSLTTFVTPTMLNDSADAIRGDFPVNTDEQDLTIGGTGPTYTIDISGGNDVTISAAGIATLSEPTANTLLITATEVDGSVTNELQTISTSGAAGNITLSDGGGTLNLNVNDADASSTNELQTLSWSAGTAGQDEITLSNGGGTVTITDDNTQLTDEQVQDIAGGMVTGNTETLITVTYQDADGTIDYVVDNNLANYSNATSQFLTANQSITLTGDVTGTGTTAITTTIATGAVGSDELASTAVTPGAYTAANITVDADGRITAASNGSGGGAATGNIATLSVYKTTDQTLTTTYTDITSWATPQIEDAPYTMNTTSGIVVIDSAGRYLITSNYQLYATGVRCNGYIRPYVATGSGFVGLSEESISYVRGTANPDNLYYGSASITFNYDFSAGDSLVFRGKYEGTVGDIQDINLVMYKMEGVIGPEGPAGADEQDLSYTAATGEMAISGGAAATIPVMTASVRGLTPDGDGAGTDEFLREDGTWAIPPDTDTQLTEEQVEDFVGGMVTGNTETLITVTYQDADGTLDFAVDNNLANYSNATSQFLTSEVDGSTTNELQTVANTSDATSHTATLSNSGGSIQLVEGANITLTTTGTGLDGIVTIASTGGGIGGSGTTNYMPKFTAATTIGNGPVFVNGSSIGVNTTNTDGYVTIGGAGAGAKEFLKIIHTDGAGRPITFYDNTNFVGGIDYNFAGNYFSFDVTNASNSRISDAFVIMSESNTNTVSVGSATPPSSSILNVSSTSKGFAPPRMTTSQKNAIGSPVAGLQVYDLTLNQMQHYNGASWVNEGIDRVVYDTIYTPTPSGIANVTTVTSGKWRATRIGNIVEFSGDISVTPTAAANTTTTIAITLPIASDFVVGNEAAGTAVCDVINMFRSGIVQANTPTDRLVLNFSSNTTSPTTITITGSYEIL